MNAVAYTRVSTSEQARSGISLPDQEDRIKEYCSYNKINLLKIYKDPGVSAGKALSERPGGADLLDSLDSADAIIAIKLDRLFRNTIDCLQTVQEWDKQGKALHLLDFGGQAFNTKSAMGKTFLTMTAAFAELEREMIRERILLAHDHLTKNGKWHGGPLPFGYKYDDGKIVIDDPAAAVVREVYKLRIAGSSIDSIARQMEEKGYRSHQGKKFNPLTIKRMLENNTLIAEREKDGNVYPMDMAPVIDRESWDKVRAIKSKANGGERNRYLLSGISVCGLCGGPMIHAKNIRPGESEYICKGRKTWKNCKGVGIREHIVEDFVLEKFFARVMEDYPKAEKIAAEREVTFQKQTGSLKKKLAAVENKQDLLFHKQAEGKLDPAQWERLNKGLSEQAEALRNEIVKVQAEETLPPSYNGDIREDWKDQHLDEKRHALSLYVEKIIVNPGKGPSRIEIIWRG